MGDTINAHAKIVTGSFRNTELLVTGTIQKSEAQQTWADNPYFKTFVPFLFTIFVFFLGQLLTVYLKNRDRKTQLQNSKTNLETWILQLEKTAKSLVEHCLTFSKALKEQKEVQRVALHYTPTLINKVSELDVTEFLNFSTLNLRGSKEENAKGAFDIIQQIEYLKTVEVDLKNQYQIFLETVDKLMNDLDKGSVDLAKAQVALLEEVGTNNAHIAYTFQNKIIKHLDAWHAAGNNYQDFAIYEKSFIYPYLNIIQDEVETNPQNPQTGIFAEKVHVLRKAVARWKAIQNGYSDLIKQYAEDYKIAYNNLKNSIHELQKKNLVNTWFIK